MSNQDVDAQFRRFAEHGDTAALGEVFDSTWEELFRVALHFVERPDEAEDLVQATWITAIEKARERDPERRLMPWLVGILALHAREMRRERRRKLDPQRIEQRVAPSADQRAESIELASAVRNALTSVPESYRETLRRFLVEGHKAVEIALETGQRPATVRMQLHRGLEHLRKALPAGLALGGAALVAPTRGMAAVRDSVLASGVQAAASFGTATTSSLIVGTLTMKKLIAVAALLVLLMTLGWWIAPHPSSADVRAVVASPAKSDATLAHAESAQPAPVGDATRVEPASRVAVVDPVASLEPDSDFARVSGRVLTATGSAVADVDVALVEIDPSLFAGGRNAIEIVRSTAKTDAAGRFTLGRGRPSSMHLLGVDPGGAHGTMRVIEHAIVSREVTEIGDVVLSAGSSLTGRVVDGSGAPLAGARVRVLVLPAQMAQFAASFAEFAAAGVEQRSVWLMLGDRGARALAFDDARIKAALDKLPVPTVASDAHGEFALTDLATGTALVVVDAPHRSPAAMTVELNRGSNQIDALTMRPTQRVTGVVVDTNGAPVGGAEVLVGIGACIVSETPHGTTPCVRAPRTDAAGRFALDDVPAAEHVGVCARRGGAERWTLARGLDPASELKITLDANERCTLEVVDGDGQPLATAQATAISLTGSVEVNFERTWEHADKQGRLELEFARERGSFVCVKAAGCESALLGSDTTSSDAPMRVVLAPANVCALRVVDATQAPVAGAHVTLLGANVVALERGVTDANGQLALATWAVPAGTAAQVRVERAGFAARLVALTEARPSAFTIELDRGGKLVLRGKRAGQVVPVCVALMREDGSMQLARSDASGAVLASELPAGAYHFRVFEPRPTPEFLQWLASHNSEPECIARGQTTIEAGRTTELDVAVTPASTPVSAAVRYGAAPSGHGRIEGFVTLDGAPAGGAHIHVAAYGVGRDRVDERVDADSGGRFVFDGIATGRFAITATIDSAGCARKDVELADGQVQRVEFELQSSALHIEVVDADGRAAEGVVVEVMRTDDHSLERVALGKSGADGQLELALVQEGTFDVHAFHMSLGEGRAQLVAGANQRSHEVRVALERGVEFAGAIECRGTQLDIKRGPSLTLTPLDARNAEMEVELKLDGGVLRFSRSGIRAGRYRVVCWDGVGQQSPPIEIELGPQGNGALHLVFEFGQ
jgi:RNA polymerase sigma-70 factor (ECF subfamily)